MDRLNHSVTPFKPQQKQRLRRLPNQVLWLLWMAIMTMIILLSLGLLFTPETVVIAAL
ncbi:MAG: hypothetical protein VKJ46_02675 [Leptolyngbyaceae bacterium]|nr:hypothetical protein [Leptolyngbyaceae bacterium]